MKLTHTKLQPKHNDSLARCSHLDGANAPDRWFYSPGGVMTRPDGSHFRPQWLACCDACFRASGEDVRFVPFTRDDLWVGDEPIILTHLAEIQCIPKFYEMICEADLRDNPTLNPSPRKVD